MKKKIKDKTLKIRLTEDDYYNFKNIYNNLSKIIYPIIKSVIDKNELIKKQELKDKKTTAKKTKCIKVRLTESEYNDFKEKCSNMSAYITDKLKDNMKTISKNGKLPKIKRPYKKRNPKTIDSSIIDSNLISKTKRPYKKRNPKPIESTIDDSTQKTKNVEKKIEKFLNENISADQFESIISLPKIKRPYKKRTEKPVDSEDVIFEITSNGDLRKLTEKPVDSASKIKRPYKKRTEKPVDSASKTKRPYKKRNTPSCDSAFHDLLFDEKFTFMDNKDITEYVSNKTGIKKESVVGTLFTFGKCYSASWFIDNFVYIDNKIWSKKYIKSLSENVDVDPLTYTSEEKQKSRKFICESTNLAQIKNPKVLTFASKQGNDVQYIQSINDSAEIYNVEKNHAIFTQYKSLNFNTNDFNMNFYDFLQENISLNFYLINVDCHVYLSESLAKELEIINDNKLSEYVSITIQDFKGLRNRGPWVDSMKLKYIDVDDKTLNCISDYLSNYKFLDAIKYQQPGHKTMQTLLFKLKWTN
jgi:hypothetical protein